MSDTTQTKTTQYLKLEIAETERPHPGADGYRGYEFTECFKDMDDLKEFLIDRYGKIPNGRNKVYVDKTDGSIQEVGFTHSYWRDHEYSGEKSTFVTDWVSIMDVTETPRLLHGGM